MSSALLLMAVGLGAEVLLVIKPQKWLRLIALCVFGAAILLALLCIHLPWVSVLYAICCIVLCAVQFRGVKLVPVFLVAASALVLVTTPGVRELLYLDCRYADHFTYVSEGLCHSAVFNCNVLVDLDEGDTYQSILYERSAVAECVAKLPHGTEVEYAYVERAQTTYLASSYEDFVRVLAPTVHIGAIIPENTERDLHFPIRCILDPIT